MIRLTIERPNTIGTTYEKEYASYSDAEEFIERRVERLCDKGWEATEILSSTKEGSICLTHDDAADCIIIRWETVGQDVEVFDV